MDFSTLTIRSEPKKKPQAKTHTFSVQLLGYPADRLWEPGGNGSALRPVWIAYAGSERETDPFTANFRAGRKAATRNDLLVGDAVPSSAWGPLRWVQDALSILETCLESEPTEADRTEIRDSEMLRILESLHASAAWEESQPYGEPLFQAVPEPRRYPLAQLIQKRHARDFGLLVLDEAHEYNNAGFGPGEGRSPPERTAWRPDSRVDRKPHGRLCKLSLPEFLGSLARLPLGVRTVSSTTS